MKTEPSIKITDVFKTDEYEKFVYENPNASIFQTLDMAEVYKQNVDTEPLILVAINEDNGEILASLLAKKVQAKQGFLSSFSLHSTIRGGPVFKNTEDGIKAASLLLQEYNNKANKWGPLYTRIYPLADTPQVVSTYRENGYMYGDWNNFLIDLTKSKEELWKNLKGDKKQAINKAKKAGIEVVDCTKKEEIPIFYDLVKERFDLRDNPLEDITNFQAVFDILVPKGEAKFFFAKYNDSYIATRLVLLYKDTIYAWYHGSNSEYLMLHPNDYLVWHVLNWGSENKYQLFDFGGGGKPIEINSGWVEFKKRFGAKLVSYGRYCKAHSSKKLKFSRTMYKIYRRIFI